MLYSSIENLSNAEAVAQFKDLTVDPMPCGEVEFFLSQNGLAKRNAISGSWEGVLIDAIPSMPDVALLFEHLNGPRNVSVDTTKPEWAVLCGSLLSGLVAGGVISQDTADGFIALGGGLAYPGLDEAAVQAVRDQHAADLAETAEFEAREAAFFAWRAKWDSLMNQHINPLQDASDFSDASTIAALQAMASDWSN